MLASLLVGFDQCAPTGLAAQWHRNGHRWLGDVACHSHHWQALRLRGKVIDDVAQIVDKFVVGHLLGPRLATVRYEAPSSLWAWLRASLMGSANAVSTAVSVWVAPSTTTAAS